MRVPLNPPNPTGYRYGDSVDERPYQKFIAMEKKTKPQKNQVLHFYIIFLLMSLV